jgi:hypothetical protein
MTQNEEQKPINKKEEIKPKDKNAYERSNRHNRKLHRRHK